MNYNDYVGLENQAKAPLARRDRRMYLLRETISWAGIMALVLTIADATPGKLGDERPIARLAFILAWAVAMAWWQLRRVRPSEGTRISS